jgi:hypothetical protein
MANSLALSALILALALSTEIACRDASESTAADRAPPSSSSVTAPSDEEACAFTERLRRALFVRTSADGSEYGARELDPPLWPSSSYLLTSPRYDEIESMLVELGARNMISRDPLRRAMLERDLWAIFDWCVQTGWSQWPTQSPSDPTPELRVPRARHLASSVGRALNRVALTAQEIDALPDNLQAAVASRTWPAWVADEASLEPFLPTTLLDPNGEWVELRALDSALDFLTPRHNEEFGYRSVFAVLMRLPGGRASTLDYLRRLREFPDPLIRRAVSQVELEHDPTLEAGSTALYLNPSIPQFPVGTALALVRRMVLFDSDGRLHLSNVVESVQIRRYRRIDASESLTSSYVPGRAQHMVEFVLDRDLFVRGENGGLRAIAQDEKRHRTFMSAGMGEHAVPSGLAHEPPVLQDCMGCHGTPGIFSVDSYTGMSPPPGIDVSIRSPRLPPALIATNTRFLAGDAILYRKSRQVDWGVLQELFVNAR